MRKIGINIELFEVGQYVRYKNRVIRNDRRFLITSIFEYDMVAWMIDVNDETYDIRVQYREIEIDIDMTRKKKIENIKKRISEMCLK